MPTYPTEVEGNFGGVVRTDWIYDACRRMLGDVIKASGVTVSNCSDGAMIPGARPLDPEAVAIDTPPLDRPQVCAELEAALRRFEPGELLRDCDLAALVDSTRKRCGEIAELLDGFDPEAADFAGVYDAMREYLLSASDWPERIDAMMSGTLNALPRIGMFYGYRLEGAALRRRIFETYMAELRAILREIEQETIELLGRLDADARSPAPAA